jgi:hypothetical protein
MPDEKSTPERRYVVKDSGQRQEFDTGSKRDTRDGKGRYDLIPTIALRRLALVYENGAAKYGDRNWEKGQPLMRYVDSAKRHIECLVAGEPTEDHAAQAAWNMFGFIHTLAMVEAGALPRALDDRPPPEPQYAPAPAPAPVGDGSPHIEAWLRGGCAWCGGSDRGDCSYVHSDCLNAIHFGPGAHEAERLFDACDRARESR